jgi:hypothetical protein
LPKQENKNPKSKKPQDEIIDGVIGPIVETQSSDNITNSLAQLLSKLQV